MSPPSEQEIRELVRRVVDGVVGDAGAGADASRTAEAHPVADPAPGAPGEPVLPPAAIAVGADHGGYPLKERLVFRLREAGYTVVDCGTDSTDSVDYPDFALAVAERVAAGECVVGIVVDGAGIGSAMAANKVAGIRAALCYDVSTAHNSREHNHANVLTLGAGLIGSALAWQIVESWLGTAWAGGRHERRVRKITDIERRTTGRGVTA